MLFFNKNKIKECQSSTNCQNKKRFCLTDALAGDSLRVCAIDAGRKLNSRLAALGILPGIRLRVSETSASGQIVLFVGQSRIAIGHGMANKILVCNCGVSNDAE